MERVGETLNERMWKKVREKEGKNGTSRKHETRQEK